jgi:glycosyltransferase involved in cell wall biosynthesis
MARILGLIVTKNEAGRFLDCNLAWHAKLLDGIVVYDDQSHDATPEIAAFHRCEYVRRDDGTPTFLEHEGAFRQAGYEAFERILRPEMGDWILAFDADEFLVSRDPDDDERIDLEQACRHAETLAATSVHLPRPEAWEIKPLRVRQDGFWGNIKCTRLFRWQPGGVIQQKPMGCGSEPGYVAMGRISPYNHGLYLMHYGYVAPADRLEKYHRYASLANHGHNDAHIESILDQPVLQQWEGSDISVWRGSTVPE